MEEYTNKELGLMLKNITKQVDNGFKGVHSRQDTTNDNVAKNTEWRLKQEGGMGVLKFVVSLIGLATIVNVIVSIFK